MKLTKEEKAWVKKLNKVLAECPSDRLGFYTIGDPQIELYDRTHQNEIEEDGGDLVRILARNDWGFDDSTLYFPAAVDGVCG